MREEELADAATAHAFKRVLALQLQEATSARTLSKSAMAKRMNTSGAQLDRLLDPTNDHVQLDTIQRAAAALGRRLHLEIV